MKNYSHVEQEQILHYYICCIICVYTYTNFLHCLPRGPLLKNDTRESISLDC